MSLICESKNIPSFLHNSFSFLYNIIINDETNNNKNFNTLKLEFFNYPNKIVKIGFVYNSDYENKIYKTYQYQNKNWVEIPTIDEYKFYKL
jgi:hypothetical protein